MCAVNLSIEEAVNMLGSNDIAVQRSNTNSIIGGKRIIKLDAVDGLQLVRIENPFRIQSIGNTWFALFVVGQLLIPIKVSESLEEATRAVINLFHISIMQSEDIYDTLKPLSRLYLENLIPDIISYREMAIYATDSNIGELQRLAQVVNSPSFHERSHLATIAITGQGSVVRLEINPRAFETKLLPNIEEAAKLIINRQQRSE